MNARHNTVFAMVLLTSIHALLSESQLMIRALAFIPTASRFKSIYGNSGPALEAQIATCLYHGIQAWANIDWFSKRCRSIGFCDPTKISIANLSCGLTLSYALCDYVTFFAGIGPSIAQVKLTNKSLRCCESITKNAFGFVVKSGITY